MKDEQPVISYTLLELQVPNFRKIKEFYRKLGFEVIWERQPEEFKGYLVLKMENNILCFWAGNKKVYEQEYFQQFPKNSPRGYAVEIVIMVSELDKYYAKVKNQVKIFEDLQQRPWGLRDFRIVDPFGFYLRITTYYNILDPKYAVK